MSYNPRNPNGQAVAASSAPVVLASDQMVTPGTPNAVAPGLPMLGTVEVRTFSYTTATTGVTYDVGNYAWVSVHNPTFYTGQTALTFQVSNDGTNWTGLALESSSSGNVAPASSVGVATTINHGPLTGRYFRVSSLGTGTSGTGAGTIVFHSIPRAMQSMGVSVLSAQLSAASASASTAGYLQQNFDGALLQSVRVPNIFKTVTATASGDTALWTPTSGKKFRVMRYQIFVTAEAAMAAGGALDIILRDATTGLPFAASLYVPTAGGTVMGAFNTGQADMGNGYLSTAANNVLNVNLSAALTAGKVRVVVAGTEE